MQENSIYTITAPDMMLLDKGPTITVISEDQKLIKEVERVHENMFKTVPVNIYLCDGPVNENNVAWVISVMRLSDNVFVDLDTVNELGTVTALLSDSNVVYISKNNVKRGMIKLFNSIRKDGFTVYESPDDYMQIVIAGYSE